MNGGDFLSACYCAVFLVITRDVQGNPAFKIPCICDGYGNKLAHCIEIDREDPVL
jgi:hypothetical protein